MVLVFGWFYAESKGTYANGALDVACARVGTIRLIIILALIPTSLFISKSITSELNVAYFTQDVTWTNYTSNIGRDNMTRNGHTLRTLLGFTGNQSWVYRNLREVQVVSSKRR